MKKESIILVSAILAFSLGLFGCPGPKQEPVKGPQGPQPQPSKVRYEIIQDQQSAFTGTTMPLPEWVMTALQGNLLQYGTDETGKKVVYFVVIEKQKNLDLAKNNAKLNVNARIAESIQSLVTSEAAKVFEGDQETYAQYIQGAIGLLAKNVRVSGLVPVNEYWAELQEYVGDSPRDRFYSYAIRYKMDLDTYNKMLSGAWEETKKQKPDIPEQAKKKMDDLIKKMSEEY
jgi:hypothetical protein